MHEESDGAQNQQGHHPQQLGDGEDVLDYLSPLHTVAVDQGDEDHDAQRQRLSRGDGERVPWQDMDGSHKIAALADGGEDGPRKTRKGDRNRRDAAGLNDRQQSPAVEEPEQRGEGLSQIHIHAAGPRHHRGQFAITECAGNGQNAGDQPNHKQPTGRAHLPADLRAHDEDAGADHDAGDDHDGVEQTQGPAKLGRRMFRPSLKCR